MEVVERGSESSIKVDQSELYHLAFYTYELLLTWKAWGIEV